MAQSNPILLHEMQKKPKQPHFILSLISGEDSCKGDSGGPLLSQRGTDFKNSKYLVGIVSFGTNRCARGVPGLYTSIEYYLPWIKQNMKTFGGSSTKKATGVRSNFRS